MPHGHPQGAKPEEIFYFADYILRNGPPPARVKKQGVEGEQAYVSFDSDLPIVKAELAYTRDTGKWQDRKWEMMPANLEKHKATAVVPAGVQAYYLNLFDSEGRVVSAELFSLQ
jgi:hypothetical protein